MLLNTLTASVHTLLAAKVPPVKRTLVAEGNAVTTPPQVLLAAGVVATTKPVGRLSVKIAPVSAVLLGLVSLILRMAAAPGARVPQPVVKPAGLPTSRVLSSKALLTTKGFLTLSVSVVACVLLMLAPPEVAVTVPTGMVLTKSPSAAAITSISP